MNLRLGTTILCSTIYILSLTKIPQCRGQGPPGGPQHPQQPVTCSKILPYDYDECVNSTALMIQINSVPLCHSASFPICTVDRNFTEIINEPFNGMFFPGKKISFLRWPTLLSCGKQKVVFIAGYLISRLCLVFRGF